MNTLEEDILFVNDVNDTYSKASNEELLNLLIYFEKNGILIILTIFLHFKTNFGILKDFEDIDLGILQLNYKKIMYEMTYFYTNFKSKMTDFDEKSCPF